jgi:hypothetical protein
MPVAKSYQKLNICGNPYSKNGRQYVVVSYPDGRRKEVRWYTDSEYNKMYPEAQVVPQKLRSTKEVLGFKEGYITIFKGDTYPLLDWFRLSTARYHVFWGWYFVSEEPLPEIPAGIEPVQLPWDKVAIVDEDTLRSEAQIKAAIEDLIYEPSSSKHVGTVGERVEVEVEVVKAIVNDGYYGRSTFHVMRTPDGDILTWNTSAKSFEVGETYKLRGTVKEHTIYKREAQTVLTRCQILN